MTYTDINSGTSKALAEAAKVLKFFWIDDVWVTGYLAKFLQIEHQVTKLSYIHRHIGKNFLNFFLIGCVPYVMPCNFPQYNHLIAGLYEIFHDEIGPVTSA